VSAVLNGVQGTIRVSDQTRERIVSAAAELGYSPNPVARALRRGRSGSIAFVPRPRAEEHGHPLTYQLGIYIARAAARQGYHSVEVSPETIAGGDSKEQLGFLLSRRADGVIFDAPSSAPDLQRLVDHGIPVVQLLRPLDAVPTATVTVDPKRGITEAVIHLVALGHQRLAYLGKADAHEVERNRFAAFHTALTTNGVPLIDDLVIWGENYTIDEGQRLTRTLLSRGPMPSAIFVSSDVLALGVLRALYAARIRVPDVVSVISYDNTHADMLYPPLTAVAQPLDLVAESAVGQLMDALAVGKDGTMEPRRVVLPTRLCLRESTAAPRAHDAAWPN
jgi:LacI family transcriptional regulator